MTLLLYLIVMSHLYNGVSWGENGPGSYINYASSGRRGLPDISIGEELACSGEDLASIPGLGRFPGEGTGTHSSTPAWRTPWTV